MPKVPNPLDVRNKAAIEKAAPLYDRINKVWEKTEEFLKSKGILAPVNFTYGYEQSCEYSLGLQKISGKWRICHGFFHYSSPDQDTDWTVITDVPIELRVHLLKYVQDIFEALVKSNEAVVPKLEKAAQEAEETLRKLGLE